MLNKSKKSKINNSKNILAKFLKNVKSPAPNWGRGLLPGSRTSNYQSPTSIDFEFFKD